MQHLQPPDSLATQVLERLQLLPIPLQRQVLDFVNFLLFRRPESSPSPSIKPGTLLDLRGILKDASVGLNDEALEDEYTDYLLQKYQ